MSYLAREQSAAAAAPLELYRFVHEAARFTYCAGDTAFDYNAESYLPTQIRRGNLAAGIDAQRARLDIEAPFDIDVAALFIACAPSPVTLTIYRTHRGDGEVVAVWKGRVTHAEWQGPLVRLSCEPIFTALARAGLRAIYQRLCRHALYDAGCTLNATAWRDAVTLASVTGARVTVTPMSRPAGYYTGGFLESGAQRRMIRAHAADGTLTLIAPIPGLAGNAAAYLYAGCDHQIATCQAKFANSANFGGFPWIPTKNPFAGDAIG